MKAEIRPAMDDVNAGTNCLIMVLISKLFTFIPLNELQIAINVPSKPNDVNKPGRLFNNCLERLVL